MLIGNLLNMFMLKSFIWSSLAIIFHKTWAST